MATYNNFGSSAERDNFAFTNSAVENKGLFIKCEDYFESDEPQGVYFELQIDKYSLSTL